MKNSKDKILSMALKNRSAIMGLIIGMVRDAELAEDLFQDVMVAIAESKQSFDSERTFLAWSWGVARNMVRRHWSSTKRFPHTIDPAVLESTAEALMEDADADVWRQEKLALRHCLKKLSHRNQQLFETRYATNLKGPALAKATGMKVPSLRNTLLRIRKTLRNCIESKTRLASLEVSK